MVHFIAISRLLSIFTFMSSLLVYLYCVLNLTLILIDIRLLLIANCTLKVFAEWWLGPFIVNIKKFHLEYKKLAAPSRHEYIWVPIPTKLKYLILYSSKDMHIPKHTSFIQQCQLCHNIRGGYRI